MIPGDLASRLRVFLEANVKAVSVVREIPSDLPRYQAGDRFTAQIKDPLPDGSFRALVAGRTVTLALSESVKSGDTLELQVTEKHGEVIHARRAPLSNPPAGLPNDQPKPVLSQAGQIISQLLTGRHGEARPLPLTLTPSLLNTRTPNPAELAPALSQAIKQSGMFYESHLRKWVEGKIPLSSLLTEPQAQQAPLPTPGGATAPANPHAFSAPLSEQAESLPDEASGEKPVLNARLLAESKARAEQAGRDTQGEQDELQTQRLTASSPESAAKSLGFKIAEALNPVVLQQLEAISSNQLSWQGQVLPGMQLQWSLIDPDDASQNAGTEEEGYIWRSNLRVNLPNLGGIQARLLLSPQGLSLSLDTDNETSAEQMRASQASLQEALATAGIALRQIKVSEHVRA